MARVLLGEDDRFLRKAAEASLRKHGHTVLPAVDGEEVLRIARSEAPALILLDLIMPKMQGFEVLRALKDDQQTRAIPVIVLSNLEQEQDRHRAMEAGALAYLVKGNLSLENLVARVDAALAPGSSPAREDIR
jgi:DNA-binding response OmpR family regulator